LRLNRRWLLVVQSKNRKKLVPVQVIKSPELQIYVLSLTQHKISLNWNSGKLFKKNLLFQYVQHF
jgi:hypothetical protein